MIGRLLKWAGFDRSRTSRSSSNRPARSLGRRLAFESVEHRVLLSANGNESVAEGGGVYMVLDDVTFGTTLEIRALSDQHGTWQSDLGSYTADGYLTAGGADNQPGSNLTTVDQPDVDSTDIEGIRIKPAGSLDVIITNSYDGRCYLGETASITAPESEELPLRDIAPIDRKLPLGDRGLVDVGRIVRPEIGATIEELDLSKPPGTASETQLADANASAAEASIQTVAYRSAKSLAGSRSRLAAFDLAMRDDASVRHAHLEHATPSSHAVDASTPAVETSSPRHDSAQAPALSSLPGNARRPMSELEIAAHDLALADFTTTTDDSPDLLETTLTSRSPRSSTTNVQHRLDAHQFADARAAYLDQRREKPVVHLVAAIGIGSALATPPKEPAPHAEHEQLPPRRRQLRRT